MASILTQQPSLQTMGQFEASKAYAVQEETFFDDGREEELVEFILTRKPEIQGNPSRVLQAIDEFGRTQKYLMNIGEHKGKIVTDVIEKTRPQTMIELGGYCGYSTILFGSAVREAGGKRYYSLERSPKFAKVITTVVEVAGLQDIIQVVVGPSNQGIKRLFAQGLDTVDMMFLDHYKPAYTTDLKLCEELGLVKEGTVLVADNVIKPGNPPYLEYVRSTAKQKMHTLTQGTKRDTDDFPGRAATQYNQVEQLSTEVKGNPRLMYDSQLVNSFEPTGEPDGVEITICIGVDQDV